MWLSEKRPDGCREISDRKLFTALKPLTFPDFIVMNGLSVSGHLFPMLMFLGIPELLFVLCATMFADPGAQNAQLNSTYLSGAELASVRLPQSAVPETAVMSLIWWTQQSSE